MEIYVRFWVYMYDVVIFDLKGKIIKGFIYIMMSIY